MGGRAQRNGHDDGNDGSSFRVYARYHHNGWSTSSTSTKGSTATATTNRIDLFLVDLAAGVGPE